MDSFSRFEQDVSRSIPYNLDVCVSFVLFHNSDSEIADAIAQVRASRVRAHVIVVDNSCPPLNLDFARKMGATVVSTGKNVGYGRGHNIALSASKGRCRYNLIMNTDIRIQADAIAGMVAFMDANSNAGLAMPKVIYPDGSLQRLCRLLPDPSDMVARRILKGTNWAKAKNARYEFHGWDYDTVAQFPFLSGCFMMCRRSVLDKVGYFDERYFLYAEDLDLSRRINSVSATLFNPDETVVHEYRSQSAPSLRRMRYAATSLTQYFIKWGWFIDRERDRINNQTLQQFANGHR